MTLGSEGMNGDDIRAAYDSVRAEVDAAARAAGRDPSEVRLLPVSKTVPVDRLRPAVEAGLTELAENKPQEVGRKAGEMADLPVRWVAIGHLQTNKAKIIAEHADEFQALDSVRLTQALQRRLETADRHLDVLIQVNTSGEEAKTGASPGDVGQILEVAASCDRLRVRGFMTVATNTDDEAEVRRCFAQLRGVLTLRGRTRWSTRNCSPSCRWVCPGTMRSPWPKVRPACASGRQFSSPGLRLRALLRPEVYLV